VSGLVQVLVAAIAVRDGNVLVLRRSVSKEFLPGVWGLPGGRVEFGEDPGVAVLRELREEAAVTGTLERLCGYSSFVAMAGDSRWHGVQLNFAIRLAPGNVRLDDSNDSFRWVDLDRLGEAALDDFAMEAIQQYTSRCEGM
jgi:8-oxo-dGTP diphosphatase